MRTTKSERIRAGEFSTAVDELLRDANAQPEGFDPADAELLNTARQLARLPSLLGSVDPAFEQRVMRPVQAGAGRAPRLPYFRPGWAAAGLTAVLLVVMLLTPLGQTAVASFMAVFNLGRTEMRITPVSTSPALPVAGMAESTAIQQSLTLAEAEALIGFPIPQPAYLPSGYDLRKVSSFSYPDLPAWVPQPLFVELTYRDGEGNECALRVYPIMLGDEASISGMNLEAAPIQDVQNVDVNGQPGVLLQLGPERAGATWQEVVWEHEDLILALYGAELTEADLLRIARSVH